MPDAIRLQLDAKSTRRRTPSGMMLADAILSRSGVLWYAPSEIGALGAGLVDPKRGLIAVYRTRASLADPATLDSLIGAPITLGHPADGVTPATYQRDAVGTVIGEPRVVDEDGVSYLVAPIIIGSDKALANLESGSDELSIGYDHQLEANEDEAVSAELRSVGPILVNHVAIVDRGRAGRKVRVLDEGTVEMEPDELKAQVLAALADALPAAITAASKAGTGDVAPTVDTAAVGEAVAAAVLAGLQPVLDAEAERQRVADEKAKADSEAAFLTQFDTLVKAGVDEAMAIEKARLAILNDCLPYIGGTHADHDGKTGHELLVAAVGDKVKEAASQDDLYLRGALAQMKPGPDKAHVVKNEGQYTGSASGDAETDSARDKMIESLREAHNGSKD